MALDLLDAAAVQKAMLVAQPDAIIHTSWPYARQGGPIKTEDDPLDPRPVSAMAFTTSSTTIRRKFAIGFPASPPRSA